jgi:hypothetical protein
LLGLGVVAVLLTALLPLIGVTLVRCITAPNKELLLSEEKRQLVASLVLERLLAKWLLSTTDREQDDEAFVSIVSEHDKDDDASTRSLRRRSKIIRFRSCAVTNGDKLVSLSSLGIIVHHDALMLSLRF